MGIVKRNLLFDAGFDPGVCMASAHFLIIGM